MQLDDYIIDYPIGFGSCGTIHLAHVVTDHLGTKNYVAIKKQKEINKDHITSEYKIYKSIQGALGIPKIKAFGKCEEGYAIVMDLLGPSLSKLHKSCDSKFTLKTVLMLADQMIQRLEFIHSKNIIHKDVKQGNFLIGIGDNINQVYLIDFGLATKFINEETNQHIPFAENVPFNGNHLTCSVNSICGFEQSRRDDLESLGYVLLKFLAPLPWEEKDRTLDKNTIINSIIKKKLSTSLEDLCKPHPGEFLTYLEYCKNLKFEDTPNYSYLRELFQNLLEKQKKFSLDYDFDWCKKNVDVGDEESGNDEHPEAKRQRSDL